MSGQSVTSPQTLGTAETVLMYIDTTHYHPFKLGLSRDDLQELLDTMDGDI